MLFCPFAKKPPGTRYGSARETFPGVAVTEYSYYYGHQPFENTLPAFYFFYNTSLHGNKVDFSEPKLFSLQKNSTGYTINRTRERIREGT
jgi:hypothetical protein